MARRLFVPLRFALVRTRAHAQRTVLAGLGIAVAAAVLAMASVGAVAVQDRAVQRALGALQPSDRVVQANWSGVPAQSDLSLGQLDRKARAALGPVLGRAPFRVMVFRQATWGGAYVSLGAVDGLGRWLELRSGRLPRACTPARCELVQIGGRPAAPHVPALHVVGRAVFRPGAPLAAFFGAAGKRPPVLLAEGVLGFAHVRLPDAAVISRELAWVVPVAPGAIHEWEIPSFQRRLDQAQTTLEGADLLFSVSGPTDALAQIRSTSTIGARRLLVVGGDAALLLLGFAVLASTRLRRDHLAVRRRLGWLGARRWQVLLVAATEIAGLTLLASLLGWTGGTGLGALLSRHLGSDAAGAIGHSVLTWRGAATAGGLAAATAIVMLLALASEGIAFGSMTISPADVAAVGALGAILLALARGKADAASLAGSGGTGVVLLLLPGLVIFVLAVLAARLLSPLLRLLERLGRRGPVALRLALLSLARAPGQVILSVVFFVISVSVAVFAIAYRGTLLQGERDQARFAVPADYVLQEDLQKLVPIQQAATPARYATLGTAVPVLRDAGYVGGGGGGRDFTLLSLPASEVARVQGWRSDFSADSRAELARRLAPPQPAHLAGLDLPAHASRLVVPATVRGDRVGVFLTVLDRRGDFSTVAAGELDPGRHRVVAPIPPEARGGRIVAVHLTFPVIAAFVAGHRESGTALSVSDYSRGVLRLGPLVALRPDGTGERLGGFAGWFGGDGIAAASDGSSATLRFVVNRAADSFFRPREPLEGEAVPVVVSPALAARAASGNLALHVENAVVPARIVGVARFFPSVDGDFAVADSSWWFAAANAAEPGSAVPSEIWIRDARPGAAARLAAAPFSRLDSSSQRALYASLHGDPLAEGTLAILLATGLVGLVLAAIGVLLTVVGDLRDESGELFDLEAQGASPADVRRHLLLRAAAVAAVGLAGGLAAGLVVSALVAAVVTVTAGAGTPQPPLASITDWPLVLTALAAVGAAAVAGALAATRLAFDRVGRWRFSEGLG